MDYEDQRTRIRRYLRDPDGNIWANALLLNLYNDVQREIHQKAPFLEDVEALRIPPIFHCGYLFDWEWTYMSPDEGKCYQALNYLPQGNMVASYRFEITIGLGIQDSTADEGTHFTQPWEAWMVDGTVGSQVPIWFPRGFDRARWVGYDRKPLTYLAKKYIMSDDSSFLTHTGRSEFYYREDELENTFVIYPLPSSPSWDEIDIQTGDLNYVYTFSWEPDQTVVSAIGAGQEFTIYHSTQTMEYIFEWEEEHLDGGECLGRDQVAMRGQWLHEIGEAVSEDFEGMVTYLVGDTVEGQTGTIIDRDETLFPAEDYGVAIDIIDVDNNVLLIYRGTPEDIVNEGEESDYPPYMQKYIECGVLERAYAVNNDGKIDSLRDYWAMRKNMGIRLIKQFMSERKADRNYRLVTRGVPGRRTIKHPRLPDAYPPI